MTIEQHIPPQNIRINKSYRDKDLYKSLHIHIFSSNQEISDYVNMTMTWSQTLQEREMFKYWLQDPNMPRILFFHDSIERQKKKGDIGKTWLLKQRQDIAMQHCQELISVSTDFFNIWVFYDTYESIEQNLFIAIVRFLQKIPNIHQNELAINFPMVSFVRKPSHGEDFVLHDEMRRFFKKGVFARLYRETNILLTDEEPITKWDSEEAFFQYEPKSLLTLYRLYEMRCVVIEYCWENVDLTKHRYKKRNREIIDSYSQEWVHTQNKRLMKLLFSDSSISLILRNSIRCYKEYLLLGVLNVLAQIRKETDPRRLGIHLSGLQKTKWSQIYPSSSIRTEHVWKDKMAIRQIAWNCERRSRVRAKFHAICRIADKIKIRLKATHIILLLINLNCLASENLTVLRNGVFVRLSRETNILIVLTDGKPITKWDTEEAFFQYEHKPILALYRLFCCHLRNEKQEQLAIQSFEMKKPQTRVQEALEQ
jgi:hypothetical protein